MGMAEDGMSGEMQLPNFRLFE
ncbi:hypothetical protein CCACVL1_01742 [Corchorus capsularis]|uniref:Uncharacterized protein n=1 Tax=Corchorus capsularis TaxID=210143 RepID=A0A1R3KG13_COCAP|nr:hypothetical protein CCACVL1_01742 [Corchorus capsularis]